MIYNINSADPKEITHNHQVAFHLGLQCMPDYLLGVSILQRIYLINQLCNFLIIYEPHWSKKNKTKIQPKILTILLSVILTCVLGAQNHHLKNHSFEHPQYMVWLRDLSMKMSTVKMN